MCFIIGTDIVVISFLSLFIAREALLTAVMDQDTLTLSQLLADIDDEATRRTLANQLLPQALDSSNRDIFEILRANGADINSPIESAAFGPFQLTKLRPLEFSIISGKAETVSILLKMGADINFVDGDSQTPLHLACATAYFPVKGVRNLLDAGADCNTCCPLSPLHIAAACGRPAVVKLLLDYGADIHLTDTDGNTCLTLALSSEHSVISGTSSRLREDRLSCAKILLEAGSDANHNNANGVSILYSVTITPSVDREVLGLLLSRGADPNSGDKRSGITPLINLAKVPLKTTTDLMSILLEHGAEINKADKRGNTALHYAATNNNLNVLPFLIDSGSELCALNDQKLSFLDKLSHEAYLDLLPSLLGRGVYPTKVTVHRGTDFDFVIARCDSLLPATPLTLALCYSRMEIASRFREIGFLTGEDINWLPHTREVRNKLPAAVTETYDNVASSGPCPLTLMSFVKVSDLLGVTPGRPERVAQLRLPLFLKERLLFKCRMPATVT